MSPSFILLFSILDRCANTRKFWPLSWGYCWHRDWSPGRDSSDSSPGVLSVYQKDWRVWWPFSCPAFPKANRHAWEREGHSPLSLGLHLLLLLPKPLLLGTNSCGLSFPGFQTSCTPLSLGLVIPIPIWVTVGGSNSIPKPPGSEVMVQEGKQMRMKGGAGESELCALLTIGGRG